MDHKELEVWKRSIRLVKNVYETTRLFPKDELYGLISQIKRSAVSIPSNIAEGCGRNYDRELIQFLYVSLGSLAELETQLIISKELDYIENISGTLEELLAIRKMIIGLIKYLKKKQP